jgi:hypothetical protein
VLPEYRPEGVSPLAIARFTGRLRQGVSKILQQNRQLKLISLGVLGAAMIGSAFMITETNRRQRVRSGQPKVMASSIFLLVAMIAMITPSAAARSESLGFSLSTTILCHALQMKQPEVATKYSANGEGGSSLIKPVSTSDIQSKQKNLVFFPSTDSELKCSSSSPEIGRRALLQSIMATTILYPSLMVQAMEPAPQQSLEGIQFGQGQWKPLESFPYSDRTSDNYTQMKTVTVPAYFSTYLARILINYDVGVASWWQNLQQSYSLLSKEQQQTRLGRDFGNFAASVQASLQDFRSKNSEETYELIFEKLTSLYVSSKNAKNDEVVRQLLILAATLRADEQPRESIKRLQSMRKVPTSRASSERNGDDLVLVAMKDNLSLLLPESYQLATSSSDGSLALNPALRLYQVGIGEEFGQAATATTFGPLSSSLLSRELPHYTFDIYALLGFCGAMGCCLTHSIVIPLDVIKTKAQTASPAEGNSDNIFSGANRILQEEGVSGLFTGAQATLAGYFWYGLSVYPTYSFFKRFLGLDFIPVNWAIAHANAIALVAGALAAVVASL